MNILPIVREGIIIAYLCNILGEVIIIPSTINNTKNSMGWFSYEEIMKETDLEWNKDIQHNIQENKNVRN